jgi:toxin ParE1/3/4
MTRFVLSPAAIKDIDAIWDYTADTWNERQAHAYVSKIRDACHSLADGRSHGRSIDSVRSGYRKLPVGSHFLVYRRIDGNVIDVVRVLHNRMDLPSRLSEQPESH